MLWGQAPGPDGLTRRCPDCAGALLELEIFCTFPYDGNDGVPTEIECAERYGILIRYVRQCEGPPRPLVYWIAGPRQHLERFLFHEYTGECDPDYVADMLADAIPYQPRRHEQ